MDIEKINKTVKINITDGLKTIYPEVFEDGKVNFERLKSLLNGDIIEKEDDRFYFNWAGKSNIYKLIQAPAYGTLKPHKEKSVDFDNTENILIAGENLETLKLLLKPYFGKVKMIYIDPPYNTGKDFIYRDNFKEPLKDYLEKTGQIDSDGQKLTTNTEASGRYHSDWLNFMYPRLFLARSLLRDDGVIFVSIDDNEVHHLRMIMDEIWGEENFVASIIWIKKNSPQNDAKWLSDNHDFILLYSKNKQIWRPDLLPREAKHNERYSNPDNDPRGNWAASDLSVKTYNPEYVYPIINPVTKEEEYPPRGRCWMTSKENMIEFIEDNRVWWGSDGRRKPVLKRFLSEVRDGIVPITIWPNNEVGSSTVGRKELKEIFKEIEGNIYDNPKPTGLIKKMLKITTRTEKDSLILDFFAGSGTTGHAVWDLNKEDGGNRKFILVQLDEKVQDEEIKKEFPTVADICIERLRRVSEKYRRENTPSANADTPLQEGNSPSLREPDKENTLSANADTSLQEGNYSPSLREPDEENTPSANTDTPLQEGNYSPSLKEPDEENTPSANADTPLQEGNSPSLKEPDEENTPSLRDTPLQEGNYSPSLKGWQAKPDGVVKWNELPFNPDLKEKAKELRKAGNLSEVLFWNQVKNKQFLGLDFDRQKIIGDYIVDFYCKNLGFVIEIEGESHNYKVDYDKKREEYLNSLGLKVIHILDVDIKKNLNGVMEWLKMEIENTPSLRDTPLQEGNSLSLKEPDEENTPSANADTPLQEGNYSSLREPDEGNTPSANADTPLQEGNVDFGFKVFRLAQSNFNLKDEFEIDPSEDKEELKKKYLDWLGNMIDSPIVGSWEDEDIIYEVILKEGLNLNSKIEKIKIKDDVFNYVSDDEQKLDFYISLQNKFTVETIEEIRTTKYKGKTFVFLDNALTDNDKINLSVFVRVKVI